jgi:hypothetical protein
MALALIVLASVRKSSTGFQILLEAVAAALPSPAPELPVLGSI